MSGCFTHRPLPYDCADAFLAGTVPFVRAGLEAGDTVLVVTGVANHELLRLELGEDAARVEFVEAAEWYRHPARTPAGCLARAEAAARDGGRWLPPAGYSYLPPDPGGRGGFGLWAVRLLCSAVQIQAGGRGTTVRLRMPAIAR